MLPDALPPPSRLATFRNAFFSGALLLAPLIVTIWAFTKIIDVVGGTFRPLYESYIPAPLHSIPLLWDIVATVGVVLLVTALGYLSQYVFGKYFLSLAERAIQRIPGIGAVYNSVRQVVATFGTHNRNLFNKVVMVEFPRKGIWTIGFLTSKAQGEPHAHAGADTWTVFVPTTPNPTSGFLIMLPAREIVELEMSVGEGMKMIISGGNVIPPWPAPVSRPATEKLRQG
ncbi:MAG: DUF502 domain-containing protein [Verrucomicrobia bacterium]|nr:DUF502 domain-containing protein [Verrucomicrobiota bacterium]